MKRAETPSATTSGTFLLSADDHDAIRLWEMLLDRTPESGPFSSLSILKPVSAALGLSLKLAVSLSDGIPRSGVTLFCERKWGIDRAIVPPFVPYTYLLGEGQSPSRQHALDSELDGLVSTIERVFGQVSLHIQPGIFDIRTFRWHSWHVTPFYTYVAPIAALKEPLANWSKNNRRDYRRFRGNYVLGTDHLQPEDLTMLVEASYGRHKRALPVKRNTLTELVKNLRSLGVLTMYGAREKSSGAPVAACAVLNTGKEAAYWLAGSQPGPAMTVVMGSLFEALYSQDVRTLDMIGANTPSIAEFKRRFGMELSVYYRVEKATRFPYRLASAIRAFR